MIFVKNISIRQLVSFEIRENQLFTI